MMQRSSPATTEPHTTHPCLKAPTGSATAFRRRAWGPRRERTRKQRGRAALSEGAISADIISVKPLWSEDLSGRSLEEVLRCEAENRAWNKALRGRVAELVESRLAKHISLEAYAARRRYGNEDAAECKRRGTILGDEISSRNGRSLPSSRQ
jgi:hypothetical protein